MGKHNQKPAVTLMAATLIAQQAYAAGAESTSQAKAARVDHMGPTHYIEEYPEDPEARLHLMYPDS